MLSKGRLWLLGILALVSWGVLGAFILRTSPDSLLARYFFFALLFVGTFFTSSLLVYYLSLRTLPSGRSEGEFRVSILSGMPPAVAATAAIWLQSLRALGLVSGLILLAAMLLVELATLGKGRKNRGTTGIQEIGSRGG